MISNSSCLNATLILQHLEEQFGLIKTQIEQVHEELELNHAMFRQQLVPQLTVLTAETAILKLRLALSEAQYDRKLAHIQLGLISAPRDPQGEIATLRFIKGLGLLAFFPAALVRPWFSLATGPETRSPARDGAHAWLVRDQSRRQVLAGLRSVFHREMSDAEMRRIVRRNLVVRYQNFIESFFYQDLDTACIGQFVPTVQGRGALDAALADAKGGSCWRRTSVHRVCWCLAWCFGGIGSIRCSP